MPLMEKMLANFLMNGEFNSFGSSRGLGKKNQLK